MGSIIVPYLSDITTASGVIRHVAMFTLIRYRGMQSIMMEIHANYATMFTSYHPYFWPDCRKSSPCKQEETSVRS